MGRRRKRRRGPRVEPNVWLVDCPGPGCSMVRVFRKDDPAQHSYVCDACRNGLVRQP